MRRKAEVDLLRRVSDIRRLQRAAAEAALAQANRALLEKTEALTVSENERKVVEANWKDAVGGSALRLETLALWTEAVVRRNRQVEYATSAVNSSVSIRNGSIAKFQVAGQCNIVASAIARRARKKHLQQLEEAAQQDLADLHLQQGRQV